jgi:hypothetical protein
MSDTSENRASPLPILALLLIAAGLIVPQIPLQSQRSEEIEKLKVPPAQSVPSRLWQDPIAAVELPLDATQNKDENKRAEKAGLASIREEAKTLLKKGEGSQENSLLILPVMLVATPFPDDAELRRRVRYAIVSGLSSAGFVPKDAERMQFVSWCPDAIERHGTATKVDSTSCEDRPGVRLPYEWFEKTEASDSSDPGNTAKQAKKTIALVLWLREENFYKYPIDLLHQLSVAVSPAPITPAQVNQVDQDEPLMRVIGPQTSTLYISLLKDLNKIAPPLTTKTEAKSTREKLFVDKLRFYSYGATIPDTAAVLEAGGDKGTSGSKPESIVRVVGGDDKLVEALVHELGLRGVNRDQFTKPPQSWEKGLCKDKTILIVEGDYTYGRNLGREFESIVKDRCKERDTPTPMVEVFTYFRGLDGMLPTLPDKEERPEVDAKHDKDASLDGIPREHAQGRNQYDYLRRLADRVVDIKTENGTEHKVRAIGIFGSDVYDKLLILQAMQARMRDVVYFTTDLDARFLHQDQKESARNLVIASHFGLQLHPGLQKGAPAFRDGYQTAAYLATRLAVGDLSHVSTGEMEKLRGSPRMFEIGRTRAVDLGAGTYGKCEWPDCSSIHASQLQEISHYQQWHLPVILLFGMLVVLMTTRANKLITLAAYLPEFASPGHQHRIGWLVLLCVGGLIGALAVSGHLAGRIATEIDAGESEPFVWLEGVSAWPSHLLRFFALLVALTLALLALKRLRKRAHEITYLFGLRENGGYSSRACRHTVTAASRNNAMQRHDVSWVHGPFLEFNDIKRHHTGIKDYECVSVQCIWRKYLNRTCGVNFWLWISSATALFGAFAYTLYCLDPPVFSHRGTVVENINAALWVANVMLLWATIFWTVFEAISCAALVDQLATRKSSWADKMLEKRSFESGVPRVLLIEWVDFEFMVKVVDRINPIVYVPFVQIFLLGLAFHPIFDVADIPIPLLLITGISLFYVIYAMSVLRRTAERAKQIAIGHYKADLLWLLGGKGKVEPSGCAEKQTSGRHACHEPLALDQLNETERAAAPAQINALMELIENTREGPFLPLLQQPSLKAFLIPFSGLSGISFIEPALNYFGL